MFEPERLKTIGGFNNTDFGGDVFSYSPSADVLADILAEGFFNPAYKELNHGDLIYLSRSEGGIALLWVLESIAEGVKVANQYEGPPIT